MKYYIKERHNPQLSSVYYSVCGQLTKKEAKKYESSLYGTNYMLSFNTKEEYESKIKELKNSGQRVY